MSAGKTIASSMTFGRSSRDIDCLTATRGCSPFVGRSWQKLPSLQPAADTASCPLIAFSAPFAHPRGSPSQISDVFYWADLHRGQLSQLEPCKIDLVYDICVVEAPIFLPSSSDPFCPIRSYKGFSIRPSRSRVCFQGQHMLPAFHDFLFFWNNKAARMCIKQCCSGLETS